MHKNQYKTLTERVKKEKAQKVSFNILWNCLIHANTSPFINSFVFWIQNLESQMLSNKCSKVKGLKHGMEIIK